MTPVVQVGGIESVQLVGDVGVRMADETHPGAQHLALDGDLQKTLGTGEVSCVEGQLDRVESIDGFDGQGAGAEITL